MAESRRDYCLVERSTKRRNKGDMTMSVELSYLAMYGLFTLILILVQVLISSGQHGLVALAGNREGIVSTGMAARAEKAVNNTILALAMFAPAAMLVGQAGVSSAGTEMAARIFLAARIVYAVLYFLGIPWLRTGAWVIGFLCTAYLYLMVV